MRIAIIGAGITGLTAAYRLSQKSHQVTIFEKENYVGGLAAGFKKKGWNWHLENFFHHLFSSDQAAKNLIAELELSNKLFYVRPKASIFLKRKASQFDSPTSLLNFPHLSFSEKLRTGVVTAYLKLKNASEVTHLRGETKFKLREHLGGENAPRGWEFEKIAAQEWLKKYYGHKPYQILWQPLLKAKFGVEAKNISMAWFWARIKKRSAKLGYLEGGFQVLIDKLVKKITENGGKIHLNQEITPKHLRGEAKNFNFGLKKKNFITVSDLGGRLKDDRVVHLGGEMSGKFDRVIVTTPTSVFLKISPDLPKTYILKMAKLKMLGALNLILVLKEKFLTDGTYWLNINEPDFPFVAVVEHTNFVNPKHYDDDHIVYVGGYYPQNHPYFKTSKEEIFKEFLPYLKKINPQFNQSTINNYQLTINLCAQPIIPTNYSKIIPKMTTPIPKVYLANMQMVYPWDRGINYAIELGGKIADAI